MRRCLVFLALAFAALPAAAEVFFAEDFDDQSHPLTLYGGSGHTIGGGVSSQAYAIRPDGGGYDFELRLDMVSLASDESSSVGSYVWPAARVLVPELADASFSLSSELTVDAASADGSNRSLSVGLAARCSYLYNADSCASFDASVLSRYYRLSYAIVGEGTFTDTGAPLASGQLRLYEHQGDGQVDATVTGVAVPLGAPFTMSLEGTVVGETLELVGRMSYGAEAAVVEDTDPTPLVGPGFGVRTGGSVKGFGGGNATGSLDVDMDDLVITPEPGATASALAACLALLARRAR